MKYDINAPVEYADPTLADANPDEARAVIVGRVEHWEAGERPAHHHQRHQLMAVSSGVMHISTSAGRWVLPATRAIWIGAGTEHTTLLRRPATLRVLYIDPHAYALPKRPSCRVIQVSPLVRELINACTQFSWNYPDNGPEARLAQVLIDQITTHHHAPVDLPMPLDARARKVVKALQTDPSNREPLTALAARAGASARTIERLFSQEAGISFGNWRQRHRLLTALEQLAYGESVRNVAHNIGYDSPSSFISAFKQLFGTTPARYFK